MLYLLLGVASATLVLLLVLLFSFQNQLSNNRQEVDSKLSTFNNSVANQLSNVQLSVTNQLNTMQKDIGEMREFTTSVGDLKRILANPKTRGISGELQLDSILQETLPENLYEKQFPIEGGRVDFAIRFPGSLDENVFLPIDAKFPLDQFERLVNAYDNADSGAIGQEQKALRNAILEQARSISTKYIQPPITTNFAIMFLPIESLFAEVCRDVELIENLNKQYKITIAGPTTIVALLNSFRMGFKTLAIQKKSSEIFNVLNEVNTEFSKFSAGLNEAQTNIKRAGDAVDKVITTRSNMIQRKLDKIENLELPEEIS